MLNTITALLNERIGYLNFLLEIIQNRNSNEGSKEDFQALIKASMRGSYIPPGYRSDKIYDCWAKVAQEKITQMIIGYQLIESHLDLSSATNVFLFCVSLDKILKVHENCKQTAMAKLWNQHLGRSKTITIFRDANGRITDLEGSWTTRLQPKHVRGALTYTVGETNSFYRAFFYAFIKTTKNALQEAKDPTEKGAMIFLQDDVIFETEHLNELLSLLAATLPEAISKLFEKIQYRRNHYELSLEDSKNPFGFLKALMETNLDLSESTLTQIQNAITRIQDEDIKHRAHGYLKQMHETINNLEASATRCSSCLSSFQPKTIEGKLETHRTYDEETFKVYLQSIVDYSVLAEKNISLKKGLAHSISKLLLNDKHHKKTQKCLSALQDIVETIDMEAPTEEREHRALPSSSPSALNLAEDGSSALPMVLPIHKELKSKQHAIMHNLLNPNRSIASDIKYDDVVALLHHLGGSLLNTKGSHRSVCFKLADNTVKRFGFFEPHGSDKNFMPFVLRRLFGNIVSQLGFSATGFESRPTPRAKIS